jgi:hypothetical protein
MIGLCLHAGSPTMSRAEEGKKEGAQSEVSHEAREYSEKTAKLNALAVKIETAERSFQEAVRRKAEADTDAEKQAAIQDMLRITKDRNADVEKYNKLKDDLTYRYPGQGKELGRRYHTRSKRSLEEMETSAGLDDLLTHTKKLIDKKYAPFQPAKVERAKAPLESESDDKPKRLRLEK